MDKLIREIRTQDVTSTEVAALFGCSPYKTHFELWHEKRNKTSEVLEENERMQWGLRLQSAIARGVAEDNGWLIREKSEYVRNKDLRIGASFDFEVETPVKALLEIKNVDALQFRDGWIVDGDYLEAPPHIELQVQHQMLVSGIKQAYIGALVGGNKVHLIHRELDDDIAKKIKDKVAAFWDSVDSNREPSPVFPQDADAVIRQHGFASPGKILIAQEGDPVSELVYIYQDVSEVIKRSNEHRDEVKAKILMLIGDHEKVTSKKFTISAGMIGPAHIEYDRDPYRCFRITFKKDKANGVK